MEQKFILGALALVVVVTIGADAAILVSGGDLTSQLTKVGVITAFVAPTVAALLSFLQSAKNTQAIGQTKELVNGHLQQHIGHTDAEVEAMIDRRINASTATTTVTPPQTNQPPPTQEAS